MTNPDLERAFELQSASTNTEGLPFTQEMEDELETRKAKIEANLEKAEKWDNASNSEKYNKCNDAKDGYCIFEKELDDAQQEIVQLKGQRDFLDGQLSTMTIQYDELKAERNKLESLYNSHIGELYKIDNKLKEILKDKSKDKLPSTSATLPKGCG